MQQLQTSVTYPLLNKKNEPYVGRARSVLYKKKNLQNTVNEVR